MSPEMHQPDLLALREVFAQLGQAIAVSDLPALEASTEALRDYLARGASGFPEKDRALVAELDRMSEELAHALASRLRAYDLAITAWRETEGSKGSC